MAAPKTVRTFVLDGSKTFTIPFEYLARKFVVVTLIGTTRRELTLNSDYRFVTSTSITTTKTWGPSDGYEMIEIRRLTSASERLVDFADGSILRAYDLNISSVQSLHIAEEARDLTADTIGVNNDGNLDARARRIVNLADAVDDGDAVTLRQQKSWAATALSYSTASKKSADESAASALAASQSRDTALSAMNRSEAARDASNSSMVKAEAARDVSTQQADRSTAQFNLATQQAVLALNAKNAAEAAQGSALNSKEAAAKSAEEAKGYAAGLNVPSATGNAKKLLMQKPDETGLTYVAQGTGGGLDADTVRGMSHTGLGWPRLARVEVGGGMEVGSYIDFHTSPNDSVDYTARIISDGPTSLNIVGTGQARITSANTVITQYGTDYQHMFRGGRLDVVNAANNSYQAMILQATTFLYRNANGTTANSFDASGNSWNSGSVTSEYGNFSCPRGSMYAAGRFYSTWSGGSLAMSTGHACDFHWNDGFYYRIDGNPWVLLNRSPSDRTLKNLNHYTKADEAGDLIDKLADLSLNYSFKENAPMKLPEGNRYGFFAQEAVQVLPSLFEETGVAGAPDGGEFTIKAFTEDAQFQLISLLVKTVGDLRARVAVLESK